MVSIMRRGALLARRIAPSGGAHATRLSSVPCRCLLRPRTVRPFGSGQQRYLQSSNLHAETPTLLTTAQKDQVTEIVPESVEVDIEDTSVQEQPVDPHSWVFANTGAHIETINGTKIKGIEEYVTHRTATKLLCSWNVGCGDERTVWVPGDAPRVRDLKLPVDLKPEAMQVTPPSSDWALGNPQNSFEPFFASLATMNPQANFDSTDVIARSSTLCILLGVTRGSLSPFGLSNKATAFRITLVKNTLIINRIENETKGRTLGRGFTPTLNGSFTNKITEMKVSEENIKPNHTRAVRYDLAHLRCVVLTHIDAATGDTSLRSLTIPDQSVEIPQAPGSVNIKRGGRGVPPAAVTKLMTGLTVSEREGRRLNHRGELKLKPSAQAKIWFERPETILQGHLERASSSAPGDTSRLARISVRETAPILSQTTDACQLELRRMVALLERLRSTTRGAGGSCILTCLPSQKSEPGGTKLPPKFELFKCVQGTQPLVLDWHVDRFWSKQEN